MRSKMPIQNPCNGHPSEQLEYPQSIPFAMFEGHERQCKRNHGGQTLQVIAERGGFGPDEALAVLEDRAWSHIPAQLSINLLNVAVREWEVWTPSEK